MKTVSSADNACTRYWLTRQLVLIPVSSPRSGHEHSYVSQVICSLTAYNSLLFLHVCLTICCYPFILLGGEEHCESWVSCPRAKHDNMMGLILDVSVGSRTCLPVWYRIPPPPSPEVKQTPGSLDSTKLLSLSDHYQYRSLSWLTKTRTLF